MLKYHRVVQDTTDSRNVVAYKFAFNGEYVDHQTAATVTRDLVDSCIMQHDLPYVGEYAWVENHIMMLPTVNPAVVTVNNLSINAAYDYHAVACVPMGFAAEIQMREWSSYSGERARRKRNAAMFIGMPRHVVPLVMNTDQGYYSWAVFGGQPQAMLTPTLFSVAVREDAERSYVEALVLDPMALASYAASRSQEECRWSLEQIEDEWEVARVTLLQRPYADEAVRM